MSCPAPSLHPQGAQAPRGAETHRHTAGLEPGCSSATPSPLPGQGTSWCLGRRTQAGFSDIKGASAVFARPLTLPCGVCICPVSFLLAPRLSPGAFSSVQLLSRASPCTWQSQPSSPLSRPPLPSILSALTPCPAPLWELSCVSKLSVGHTHHHHHQRGVGNLGMGIPGLHLITE